LISYSFVLLLYTKERWSLMEMKFRAFRPKPKDGHLASGNEPAPETETVRRVVDTPRLHLRRYVIEERPSGPGKFPIERQLGLCDGSKHVILKTTIRAKHPGVLVAVTYDEPEFCNENGKHGEGFSVSVLTIYERVAYLRARKMLPNPREWLRVLLQIFHHQDLSDVS